MALDNKNGKPELVSNANLRESSEMEAISELYITDGVPSPRIGHAPPRTSVRRAAMDFDLEEIGLVSAFRNSLFGGISSDFPSIIIFI